MYMLKNPAAIIHMKENCYQAMNKYGKLIQMGNQRRSFPNLIEAVKQVQRRILLAMLISEKHGIPTTANRSALAKKFLCLQHWILIYGRDLRQEKITRTIWFITTGIGSGIGAPVKHVIMVHMK